MSWHILYALFLIVIACFCCSRRDSSISGCAVCGQLHCDSRTKGVDGAFSIQHLVGGLLHMFLRTTAGFATKKTTKQILQNK